MNAQNQTTVLTETPDVVALKRLFRKHDERTEELKPKRLESPFVDAEIRVLEAHKAEIARALFAPSGDGFTIPIKALCDMIEEKEWKEVQVLAEHIRKLARNAELEAMADEAGVVRH